MEIGTEKLKEGYTQPQAQKSSTNKLISPESLTQKDLLIGVNSNDHDSKMPHIAAIQWVTKRFSFKISLEKKQYVRVA